LLDHTDFGTTLLDEILPYHLEYYLGIKKEYGGGEHSEIDESGSGKGSGSESDGSEKPKKKGKKVG